MPLLCVAVWFFWFCLLGFFCLCLRSRREVYVLLQRRPCEISTACFFLYLILISDFEWQFIYKLGISVSKEKWVAQVIGCVCYPSCVACQLSIGWGLS